MSVRTWASVVMFAAGCSPPCETLGPVAPEAVCHSADAGAVVAGSPFVLMATTPLVEAGCTVSVDGGQVVLLVEGLSCAAGSSPSSAKPVVIKRQVPCEVPALPEGAYVVNSSSFLTFTLPDAGIPSCP